jgi:hypothetical protein
VAKADCNTGRCIKNSIHMGYGVWSLYRISSEQSLIYFRKNATESVVALVREVAG